MLGTVSFPWIERVSATMESSKETKLYGCQQKIAKSLQLENLDPDRAQAVFNRSKLWSNNITIHYYLYRESAIRGASLNSLHNAVRQGFQKWQSLGIGLSFSEVKIADDAEIRISFQTSGSWSFIGRDAQSRSLDGQATMNFGWDVTRDADTVLHEIGHALGRSHEHQNPFSGIEWDRDAVLKYYKGPPNYWSKETTEFNILRKLERSQIIASKWDRNSVMHYPVAAGLATSPLDVAKNGLQPTGGLSTVDISYAKQVYPPGDTVETSDKVLKPFEKVSLASLTGGEQTDFFLELHGERNYTIQTFGRVDTTLVLEEKRQDSTRIIAEDDNSGRSRNASVFVTLSPKRKYILHCRLVYAASGQTGELMLF